ncbi:hypothetical protein [Polaribacter glomeratus]|nr:hypothetical protein [Polaribacter glomeratus]
MKQTKCVSIYPSEQKALAERRMGVFYIKLVITTGGEALGFLGNVL